MSQAAVDFVQVRILVGMDNLFSVIIFGGSAFGRRRDGLAATIGEGSIVTFITSEVRPRPEE
jgi:hypothetical protein